MRFTMPTTNDLVRSARRETRTWTDGELAKLLGCSRRTVQRNSATGGLSKDEHYGVLIKAVHPKNPELAGQLARARHTTLEELGLAPPAPPPDPTRPEHADSVVYAAADVLQLPPSAVRLAIAAAFAKAREHGVTIDGLARHLAGGSAKPKAKPRES
jgi:hypothetical protein